MYCFRRKKGRKDYCLLFGVPQKLFSDKDPAYDTNLFKHLTKGQGKMRTSVYNPKSNARLTN